MMRVFLVSPIITVSAMPSRLTAMARPPILRQPSRSRGRTRGRLGPARGGRQQARVQGDVVRVGDAELVDDGRGGDAP